MNQKLIIRLGGAAVAVFVLAYAASPLLAARSLVQAAKTGNEQALERQVDFPAFRASLKDELSARMVSEMRKDDRLGGLSGLGMLLAPTLVSGAVDAFVTPQAISLMVQEGKAPKPDLAKVEPGGLGILLVREYMDRLDYRWQGRRNCLIMTRALG